MLKDNAIRLVRQKLEPVAAQYEYVENREGAIPNYVALAVYKGPAKVILVEPGEPDFERSREIYLQRLREERDGMQAILDRLLLEPEYPSDLKGGTAYSGIVDGVVRTRTINHLGYHADRSIVVHWRAEDGTWNKSSAAEFFAFIGQPVMSAPAGHPQDSSTAKPTPATDECVL